MRDPSNDHEEEDGYWITIWPTYTPYGIQGPAYPRRVWMPKKGAGSVTLSGCVKFLVTTFFVFVAVEVLFFVLAVLGTLLFPT